MSDNNNDEPLTTQAPPPQRGPAGHGPMGRGGAPVEKAQNFLPSAKRLLGTLRNDAAKLVFVIVLGVLSVGLTVLGPKLLGQGTNVVFAGFISLQFPAGTSKADVIAQLVAAGQTTQADMLRAMDFVPGAGIDFTQLTWILIAVLSV